MIQPVFPDLTGQIIAAFFNHLSQARLLPVFPNGAIAGAPPGMFNDFYAKAIAKDRLGFKTPQRLLRILRPAKRLLKPPLAVVLQIDAIRRDDAIVAVVEQRVAGDFLL